jgi:hypothetical protein
MAAARGAVAAYSSGEPSRRYVPDVDDGGWGRREERGRGGSFGGGGSRGGGPRSFGGRSESGRERGDSYRGDFTSDRGRGGRGGGGGGGGYSPSSRPSLTGGRGVRHQVPFTQILPHNNIESGCTG